MDSQTPGDFSFEILSENDHTYVTLSGELDVASCIELRESFVQLSETPGLDFRVDLLDLAYLDSTGISLLVIACKRIRSQGGAFSMSNAAGNVRKVLEITDLIEYLNVAPPPRQ